MIKKSVLSLIMISLLSMFFILAIKGNSSNENDDWYLNETRNYFFGNVNEDVNLEKVIFLFNNEEIKLSDLTLSLPEGVILNNNNLKATVKGFFEIEGTYLSNLFVFYFVVKESSENEYVIFKESFEGLSNIPSDYQKVVGTSSIVDGSLFLNGRDSSGGTAIVLLPKYLEGFKNYVIEVDFKLNEATDDARWASVMYRYSANNYYQMAVRKNASASNGVEVAKAINGSWVVTDKGSFKERLKDEKFYTLKLAVLDNVVKEYIDSELIVEGNALTEFDKGRIGFQANNSKAYYKNIKITIPEEYIKVENLKEYKIPNIYNPETNIINPATTIQNINSVEDFNNALNEVRPGTFLFNLNEDLEIINSNNEIILSIDEALDKMNGKVIPAFRVEDVMDLYGLIEILEDYKVKDFFIFSKKASVLVKARELYKYTRGVLEIEEDLNKENLEKMDLVLIRNKVNLAEATAVLIPFNYATYDNVRYLQERLVTVWTSVLDDRTSIYEGVLSGVNGLVTDDYLKVFEVYSEFPLNSFIRKPFIIGHRGMPGTKTEKQDYPENSLISALKAIENGADVIELDLHITRDLEIVVYHDFTTERLYDKKLDIATSTLAELKALNYKYDDFPDTKILTFSEYMEALKDEDVVFFIEIKAWVIGIAERMRDVLRETNTLDRAVVITFVDFQIEESRKYVPELSVGYLNYDWLSGNVDVDIATVIEKTVPNKTTFNSSYGNLKKDLIKELTHRGITAWPWTIDEEELNKYYLYGAGGLTTNTTDYLKNAWLGFTLDEVNFEYDMSLNNVVQIMSNQYSVTSAYPSVPDYVIIDDGGTNIVIDKGKVVSASNEGVAKIMVYMETTLPDNTKVTLFNNIITINVTGDVIEEVVPPKNAFDFKLFSIIISGIIILLISILVPIYIIKKR